MHYKLTWTTRGATKEYEFDEKTKKRAIDFCIAFMWSKNINSFKIESEKGITIEVNSIYMKLKTKVAVAKKAKKVVAKKKTRMSNTDSMITKQDKIITYFASKLNEKDYSKFMLALDLERSLTLLETN